MSSSPADPRVAVVIPNSNGAAWLPGCLDALGAQTFGDHEVILVDNGSDDGSAALVRDRYPQVRVLGLPDRAGFAAAVNTGIGAARGEYVAMLNNDTVARPGWLAALVKTLDESAPEIGAVASKMLSLDDPHLIDDAGDTLSWSSGAAKIGFGEQASGYTDPYEVFSVCAGAALYRRSFLDDVGGFDERFFAYLEDVDIGLRGRLLGYRYVFEPRAEVLHKGQGTALRRSDYVRLITRNRLLLFAKSMPAALLIKHLPRLIYGQLYFALLYRHPIASIAGYLSFLGSLGHVKRERARLRATRRIDAATLDRALTTKLHEPPLRVLLRKRLERSRS
jgi:hypothetical protein